jgi:hypothetical protein
VHYGPLSSVWDFSKLIGAELDHTSKRESVPHNSSTSVQICKNSWAQKVFVLRVQIELYEPVSRLRFLRDGLTFSYLWNVISSQILGVRLWISPRSKWNSCRSLGRNSCLGLSLDAFMAVISISLFDQFSGFPENCLTVSTFGNCISSSILGDGVCMSTGWKHNTLSPV